MKAIRVWPQVGGRPGRCFALCRGRPAGQRGGEDVERRSSANRRTVRERSFVVLFCWFFIFFQTVSSLRGPGTSVSVGDHVKMNLFLRVLF